MDQITKNLYELKVHKGAIYGFIKNKLSEFRFNNFDYLKLIKKPTIVNYFKRFYPFQRLTAIEQILKRSKFYNKSYLDSVSLAIGNSKKLFIENVKNAQSIMATDKFIQVSQQEHDFAVNRILRDVFGNCTTLYRPTFDDLIGSMNLRASAGLPKPWVTKRQSVDIIRDIYHRICAQTFCVIETFNRISRNDVVPFTAAFVRMQITNSGLKVRLVFAVSLIFVVAETYFNLIIKYVTNNVGSTAIHGYTQPQISKLVQSTNSSHALCIDYKSFDQRVPAFVILTCATICEKVMCLNEYEKVLYYNIVSYFVTMPIFHPEVPFTVKQAGIPSGSGFTSIFGSLCNSYMLHIAIRRYCHRHRIQNFEASYSVYVSSDDTIISSAFFIDYKHLKEILMDMFGVQIELESYSAPGETEVLFLGSTWVDNVPTRNINRMMARIVFGSGNYPLMSDLELFQSRCYEILGNTVQYHDIYKTFNVPYPKRVFRFVELADYIVQVYIRSNLIKHEKRGFWQTIDLNKNSANHVWMQR